MNIKRYILLQLILFFALFNNVFAQSLPKQKAISIENKNISYSLIFRDNSLIKDSLLYKSTIQQSPVISDANYALDIVWTGWSAPHKKNNAENPVRLDKNDFVLKNHLTKVLSDGTKQLELNFNSNNTTLAVKMVLRLPENSFYLRKKIEIKDTVFSKHFIQKIFPVNIGVSKVYFSRIVKPGGFGQPIAFISGDKGVFYGLEYPAADQVVDSLGKQYTVQCSQELGQIIDKQGVESSFAVIGITPDTRLKWWFYQYMKDIRFAIDKPYTLYNSWYDLRSPAFKNIPRQNVMNEKNIMRIIDLIKSNFVDKYGIHLDAFVLDDGWDIYKSDWKTRRKTFPHGMKPISDKLKTLNTGLGIWFGPTGGYSFRKERIKWMYEHGYEVCGNPDNDGHNSMLCLAGKNYSNLFRKRTTDFVKDEGVSFFKWDGIQFSCSDPTHGHPVGIYSRRAVMQSVIDKCNAVRKINPDVYLNITSGTWLSPWWLLYANQIWMQGQDYGFAGVPSISKRDAAMTYRDLVLHEDFKQNNFWFPISNLMTHGIIKGNLQNLGGKTEPLDKFTNNAVLYFARGVSMYELYISPDILTDGEWNALSQSLKWARDRFDVLNNSFYVGGNPAEKEAYAYVHFKNDKGIIAARNPFIDKKILKIKLDPQLGLDKGAAGLAIEQVYPYHYVYKKTYSAGEEIDIKLEGYETAIYEIYPVATSKYPLITDTKFRYEIIDDKHINYTFYDTRNIGLLNPEIVEKMLYNREKISNISEIVPEFGFAETSVDEYGYIVKDKILEFHIDAVYSDDVKMALLYEKPGDSDSLPQIKLIENNNIEFENEFKQKKKWIWKTYKIKDKRSYTTGKIIFGNAKDLKKRIRLFLIYDKKAEDIRKVKFTLKSPVPDKIMPPEIYKPGCIRSIEKITKYTY